jgi:hypothetical protein
MWLCSVDRRHGHDALPVGMATRLPFEKRRSDRATAACRDHGSCRQAGRRSIERKLTNHVGRHALERSRRGSTRRMRSE